MQVPQAPKGMSYFDFIADRFDAAKTVEPSVWLGNDAITGQPWVPSIHSFIQKLDSPGRISCSWYSQDPDIHKGCSGAKW